MRREYKEAERVTQSHRLTAAMMRSAISDYGRTLADPPADWWNLVEVTPVDSLEESVFHVAAPLWTTEEGRSDLTLELRLSTGSPAGYQSEILDIHVL